MTGAVDITGTPVFTLWALRFTHNQDAKPVVRTKRTDTYRRYRQITPGGDLALVGTIRNDGYPLPTTIRNATGTVTLQFTTGKTIALSVRFTGASVTNDKKAADEWTVALTAVVTANPTLAGWAGTQSAPSAPSYNAVQTHDGVSKGFDPDNIDDLDTFRYDLEGLTDTSAAEATAVADLIAAYVATRSGMKLRRAAFTRSDDAGGYVLITCQRTTSGEDRENAGTTTTTDASGLTSSGTGLKLNGTPSTPSGQLVRTTTTQEVNDAVTQTGRTFGLRTVADDETFGRTKIQTDVSVLAQDTYTAEIITTGASYVSPSAPTAGMVVADWFDVPETNASTTNKSVRVYRWSLVTNAQATTLPRYELSTDVSDLESTKRSGVIWDSGGSEPSDASAPSGLQLVNRTDVAVASHPTKQVRIFSFAKDTPKQKAEQAKTFTDVDPQGLETRKATAAMDATPSTPSGTVEVSTRVEHLTNDHTLTTVEGALLTSADKRTFPKTKIEIDRAGLAQETYTAEIVTTAAGLSVPAAPTTDMVCTHYFDTPETNGATTNKSVRVYVWSFTTNAEKLTLPRYQNEVDPNGIDTDVRSAVVWDSTGSAPSDPALTGIRSGLKLRSKADVGLASTPKYQVRVYRHTPNDSFDDHILPHTWTEADPSNIESKGEVAASGTSLASIPAGYKERYTKGVYLTPSMQYTVRGFALNSAQDEVTHGHTIARSDAFEGVRLDLSTILSSGASASSIAATIFTANKNSTTFEGVDVRKLNDGLAEIILRTRDDQIIVRYRFWPTGRQLTPAYVDGTDVYVFLRQWHAYDSARWAFELGEQYRSGGRGSFTVERRVNGASVDLFDDLFNTSNGSAFLGLGTGKVAYCGIVDGATNISIPSPRVSRVTYGFEVDSNGFVDMADASPGWLSTTTDLSSLNPGWVKASDLGLSSTVLSGGDYSGFIT